MKSAKKKSPRQLCPVQPGDWLGLPRCQRWWDFKAGQLTFSCLNCLPEVELFSNLKTSRISIQVSCYFFTVEFGLCQEGEQMKVWLRYFKLHDNREVNEQKFSVELLAIGVRCWTPLIGSGASICDGRNRVRLLAPPPAGRRACLQCWDYGLFFANLQSCSSF